MNAIQLDSHSQALYALCMKPIMKSTAAWTKAHGHILALADCLNNYKIFLEVQNVEQTKRQKLDHPVRQIAEHLSVEHRKQASFGVKEQYCVLDACVVAAKNEPVFFMKQNTCCDLLKAICKDFDSSKI